MKAVIKIDDVMELLRDFCPEWTQKDFTNFFELLQKKARPRLLIGSREKAGKGKR